jgi:hypothetical protein
LRNVQALIGLPLPCRDRSWRNLLPDMRLW